MRLGDVRQWLIWWAVGFFLFGQTGLSAAPVRINGVAYVALDDVAGSLGMERQWIKAGERLRLRSQWTTLDFALHRRDCSLNNVTLHLGWPVAAKGNDLYISEIDYDKVIRPVLTPQEFTPVPKLFRIVIDPGHGGKDPGAQNTGLKLQEKSLALDVAKRLKTKLEAKGYEVRLTREDDRFLALEERSKVANAAKADLFISIHFNAASETVRGLETYVFTAKDTPSTSRSSLGNSDRQLAPANANDTWNMLLGYYVQRELVGDTGATDRGVKRARFTVLRDLRMPGILIEGGFVSNGTEGRQIGSAVYREKLADAIADGVVTYQRTLNRLRGRE